MGPFGVSFGPNPVSADTEALGETVSGFVPLAGEHAGPALRALSHAASPLGRVVFPTQDVPG